MLRLLADENFNFRTVRAVCERMPELEFIGVHATGLRTLADDVVLEWAAAHGYVVVSHDYATMPHEAGERLKRGAPMPGLVMIHATAPIGASADYLLRLIQIKWKSGLEGEVEYS